MQDVWASRHIKINYASKNSQRVVRIGWWWWCVMAYIVQLFIRTTSIQRYNDNNKYNYTQMWCAFFFSFVIGQVRRLVMNSPLKHRRHRHIVRHIYICALRIMWAVCVCVWLLWTHAECAHRIRQARESCTTLAHRTRLHRIYRSNSAVRVQGIILMRNEIPAQLNMEFCLSSAFVYDSCIFALVVLYV